MKSLDAYLEEKAKFDRGMTGVPSSDYNKALGYFNEKFDKSVVETYDNARDELANYQIASIKDKSAAKQLHPEAAYASGDMTVSVYNKAIGKTYRYTCWFGASKPVFDRRYVYVLDRQPDIDRMRDAAEYLTGMHDYRSFCGNTKMKKSTVRVVDVLRIEESGSYIRFYIHGNGFLQHMVRIIVGTLLQVGFGEIEPEQVAAIIEAKDRKTAGPTAPAKGLCLMKVDY